MIITTKASKRIIAFIIGHIYPEEIYNEPDPEGYYPKTVFNNGESRYYLLVPYITRPYSSDYISLMWNGIDYYSDVCIILFDEL